ncbi:hypothetical protein IIY66_01170 [Candidatus Saccharibacteria bacterium]|nr:hypothetical protein [Candidatus Saccharibacteria bacterium]
MFGLIGRTGMGGRTVAGLLGRLGNHGCLDIRLFLLSGGLMNNIAIAASTTERLVTMALIVPGCKVVM